MTFREDGEGINDRAERLDHELEMAQKSLNDARERRMQHLEQEMADAQERLNHMQATLRVLKGEQNRDAREFEPAPPVEARTRPSMLVSLAKAMPVMLPVGMVAMLGFAIGHGSARKHHPSYPMSKKSAVTATSARMTGSASTKGTASGPETTARVRWEAKVRKSTNLDIPAGTSCRIEGRFTSRGAYLAGANVEVWCGDKQVYDKGIFTGPEAVVSVDEFATEKGAFVYSLDVEDTQRPVFDKRATASIDTDAHVAVISRDIGETFRLELDVDTVATPVASSGPLFNSVRPGSAAPHARLARAAHVVSTSGAAPVSSGEKCTVEVVPATPRSGWSCRTFVRCGDKAVYGEQRTGFGDCSGDDSSLQIRDMGFTMEDGDPKLEADFARGALSIHEEDTKAWKVQLKLD